MTVEEEFRTILFYLLEEGREKETVVEFVGEDNSMSFFQHYLMPDIDETFGVETPDLNAATASVPRCTHEFLLVGYRVASDAWFNKPMAGTHFSNNPIEGRVVITLRCPHGHIFVRRESLVQLRELIAYPPLREQALASLIQEILLDSPPLSTEPEALIAWNSLRVMSGKKPVEFVG